jgi:cytochrome c-type biogenesis protein
LIKSYQEPLSKIAGVVIILFGLHFLGVFRIGLLYREARYEANVQGSSLAGAYLIGLAFAFGWTPCIGPVLSAVLTVAMSEDSIARGVQLLFVYSMGLGIPFIMAAVAIRPFLSFLQRIKKYLTVIERLMGLMLVVTGVMFLTGTMTWIGQWMIETFPALVELEGMFISDKLQRDILGR